MSKSKKIIGFTAITIAAFLGTLDSTIVNIALPSIKDYFNSTLNDVSWITTIYLLAMSISMITASKIADQFGRKKVMIIGLIIFGASSAMCGLSQSLLFLVVLRFLQGIGGAIITPIVIPMGLEIVGKENRQLAVAICGAIVALAAASGPPLGGLLIQYLSWASIFFVNIPFCIISIILIFIFIDESYDDTVSKKIDWIGMLFMTVCLFCFVFALLKGKDYGWHSTLIVSLIISSVISLVLFIFAECKVKSPVLELSLFKETTFATSSICYMMTGFASMCPILIFNYFLQNAMGYSALNAAFILMTTSITAMVSIPIGSIIAKKVSTRLVNFLGMLIFGIGIFLLSEVDTDTSKLLMIFDLFICGVGLGFSCQTIASSIKYLPSEKSGIGSGIINCFRQIGTCIGVAILITILNANISDAKGDIKSFAVNDINSEKSIIKPIRTKVVNTINKSNNSDNNDKDNLSGDSLKNSIINIMKNNVNLLAKTPPPDKSSAVAKLYNANNILNEGLIKAGDGQQTLNYGLNKTSDGQQALSDGLNKAGDGQHTLNTGICALNSGLNTLYDGDSLFNSNFRFLSQNINLASEGAKKLYTAASDNNKGVPAISNGVSRLNAGAQKLLGQFSTSNNPNSPTIYDGANGLANGTQNIETNINNYTSTVNTILYSIIKNDPSSPKMLVVYKNNLAQVKTAYSKSNSQAKKAQYVDQLKSLSSLVSLYTAATNPSVTNSSQFEQELVSANSQNPNIVSAGAALSSGSSSLALNAKKFSSQFQNNGIFKGGLTQLAGGISTLNGNMVQIYTMEDNIGKLSDILSKIDQGSSTLYSKAQNLQSGISTAKNGSNKLVNGSNLLVDGNSKLKDGSNLLVDSNNKLKNGSTKIIDGNNKLKDGSTKIIALVSVYGQNDKLNNELNKLKDYKNDKVANAFDKTFSIASIIVLISAIFGIFTDRKDSN